MYEIHSSYEEDYMVRLTSKKKTNDIGRRAQKELEELVDFSLLKGLTRVRINVVGQLSVRPRVHTKGPEAVAMAQGFVCWL